MCPAPLASPHHLWNLAFLGLSREGAGLSPVTLYLATSGSCSAYVGNSALWPCHHGFTFILAPSASVSLPSQSLLQVSPHRLQLVPTQCPLPDPHLPLFILCLHKDPASCRNPRWKQVTPSKFLGPSHLHDTGWHLPGFCAQSTLL